MFSVHGPMASSTGQFHGAKPPQGFQQFVDRRLAQLRIGGVGHPSFGNHIHSERSLGCGCDSVLGRLAVHQKLTARRLLVRDLRPQAVPFLAYQEKKSDVNAFLTQPLGCGDLSGDDSFGIARAAAVNPTGIFGRRNKRRHRIHVRRENDRRRRLLRRSCVHIAAVAFDWKFVCLVSQAAKFGVKNVADGGFVAGDRLNVYQLTGEATTSMGERITHARWRRHGTAGMRKYSAGNGKT